MAAVVIHTKKLVESSVTGPVGAQLVEVARCFLRCFEIAERLRFESEMKRFPVATTHLFNMLDATPEIHPCLPNLLFAVNKILVRNRHGADAAFDSCGKNLRKQIK